MKKFYLMLSIMAFGLLTIAQPVSRNYVLVEIGTGTWCYYCPGAAMGADDLIANGDPAAIIENHNGDTFTTDDSDGRNNYYGITGYPTANFDGSYDEVVGGSNTVSMYSSYKPIVDARILMDSDFTLDILGTNVGDDYSITLRVQNVGSYTGDNLWLRFALTESEIEFAWQGQSEVNFANRLMVPDHNGTDIGDLDLTDLTDILIDFTFDNTWDNNHCELVAFIQDDDTKEVLQSQKVELLSLEPPLIANFSPVDSVTCIGSTIDFTDLSLGTGIDTWDWTFEGATPATSSDENPSVTYNTTGVYWVELTVTTPQGSDTKRVQECITILETPGQADEPLGETTVCTDQSYVYSIAEVPYAQVYDWEIDPPDAGNLMVNANEATLTAADDWTGDFSVSVRATNICGDGDWSDEIEATLVQGPNEYTLEGGGSYCVEDDGSEITLSGSDLDIEYELFLDGVATGVVLDGTGSELSFGYLADEGYYTAVATNDDCALDMVNQIEVSVMYAPEAPATPSGNTALCNDQPSDYATTGVESADSYEWDISPEEAGTLVENDMEVTVNWNPDFAGEVQLAVFGVNDCGMGTSSEELIIDVDDVPEPVVDGESFVCDYQVETYMVNETDGNTYTWEVTGGTITDGQGTYSITVKWGEIGMGTINMEEETPNGCFAAAIEFEVTIDGCTGLGENEVGKVSMNPNPANDFLMIQAETKIESVIIFSLTGEKVEERVVNDSRIRLNTTAYSPGLYLVRINTMKGILSKRLIIE